MTSRFFRPRVQLTSQWDLGADIISSELDPATNTVYFNLGDSEFDYSDTFQAVPINPFGFVSRPPLPSSKQPSAQAFRFFTGNEHIVLGGWDKRSQFLYGAIDYGEAVFYAPGSAARVYAQANGTLSIRTNPGQDSTGAVTGQMTSIDVKPDNSVTVDTGSSTVNVTSSSISLSVGAASITLNADGTISITGTIVDVAGSVLTRLGPGGPGLAPAVNSALIGPTGIAGVPSTHVLIAP